MISPPGTPSRPLSSHASSGHILRWVLSLARGVWMVLAVLLLANFVASIPAYYQILRTVCTLPDPSNCPTGQLTPDTAAALAHLHLSLSGSAASFVTLDVVLSLLPWGIGLLIFWHKSAERMGLFVSLLLVLFGGTGITNSLLGVWAGTQPPPLLSILLNLISGAEWIGLGAFLLTFPTGRFVPRWSWLVLAFWIISFVWSLPSPVPVLQGAVSLLVFGGTLFIMVYRYVRVFDATGRQQAKWFVYAAVVSLILLFLGTGLPGVVPADSPSQLLFPTLILFSSALFYLGLGVAMLRYRLWDIDAIINRTLIYGTLTVSLALLYAGLIIGLQALLGTLIKQNNAVAIIISTLAIYALFFPLRHRLQRLIDRRFYRRKYDAAKTLEAFSATLRNAVDLERLREELVVVVQETMQPAQVSLWLPPPAHDPTRRVARRATPPGSSEER
jgi:hypothetical protein